MLKYLDLIRVFFGYFLKGFPFFALFVSILYSDNFFISAKFFYIYILVICKNIACSGLELFFMQGIKCNCSLLFVCFCN